MLIYDEALHEHSKMIQLHDPFHVSNLNHSSKDTVDIKHLIAAQQFHEEISDSLIVNDPIESVNCYVYLKFPKFKNLKNICPYVFLSL
jgi:hypothetical protein